MTLLPVAFFGLLGVLSRFGVDRAFGGGDFPWNTLAINLAGSFLAGLLYVLSERGNLSTNLQLGLLVGFCGGFTTFSAYALQTMTMIEKGRWVPALVYLTVSPALGLAAAFLPVVVARRFS